EERGIEGDQLAGEREDLVRAATILLEVDFARQTKVAREVAEHARIGAGPGVDRLLVVAHREHVLVVVRQRAHDPVLYRVQVLEFVDEDDVPTRANGGTVLRPLEQLGGLDHQRVEVDDLANLEKMLIALEQRELVRLERVAPEAMGRESVERVAVPATRPAL